MKKLLLLSAVCFVATGVSAIDLKPYIEGKITESIVKSKVTDDNEEIGSQNFRDTFVQGVSVEAGVKLDQFRIGLEAFYNDKANDEISVNLGQIAVMAIPFSFRTKGTFLNAYWDIPTGDNFKKFKPYVGGGIGYSWLELSSMGTTITKRDTAWNAGAGIAYELNENTDFVLGYRYEDLGTLKDTEGGSKADITNHKISLGLRYSF